MPRKYKSKPNPPPVSGEKTAQVAPRCAPDIGTGSAEDMLKTIDTARIDRRTRQARQIDQTITALETDPRGALKAILRGVLATGTLLQNEIMTAAGQYDLVTPEGRLPDSLSKDLIRVQRNLTGVANLLGQLEGSFPARKTAPPRKLKEGATVAEIILADDGDDGEADE